MINKEQVDDEEENSYEVAMQEKEGKTPPPPEYCYKHNETYFTSWCLITSAVTASLGMMQFGFNLAVVNNMQIVSK